MTQGIDLNVVTTAEKLSRNSVLLGSPDQIYNHLGTRRTPKKVPFGQCRKENFFDSQFPILPEILDTSSDNKDRQR